MPEDQARPKDGASRENVLLKTEKLVDEAKRFMRTSNEFVDLMIDRNEKLRAENAALKEENKEMRGILHRVSGMKCEKWTASKCLCLPCQANRFLKQEASNG